PETIIGSQTLPLARQINREIQSHPRLIRSGIYNELVNTFYLRLYIQVMTATINNREHEKSGLRVLFESISELDKSSLSPISKAMMKSLSIFLNYYSYRDPLIAAIAQAFINTLTRLNVSNLSEDD